MAFRVAFLLFVGALTWPLPDARAQDSARRVTLDEALGLFASHSLELRISRASSGEASGNARQAAAYPNPSVSASHETLGSGAAGYRESYLNLGQRLDWPWLASARGASARHRAMAETARVTGDSIRLTFEVRSAFGDAVAAEALAGALVGAADLVRRAERQAIDRGAAGDISPYDVRRLRAERLRYEHDLDSAVNTLRTARRRLAALILPDSAVDVAPAAPLQGRPRPVSLLAILQRARTRHPRAAEAEALAAAAREAQRAATADRLPSPVLTAGYKTQSDGASGLFLGAGVSVPLFDRRGGAVAAARSHAAATAARVNLAARLIENDVRRTHEAFVAALARAELLGDSAVAEADALLRIARISYDEGEMSLVELLDAVGAYRSSRAAAVEAGVNLWTSFFDLERAVGSPLADLPLEERQ